MDEREREWRVALKTTEASMHELQVRVCDVCGSDFWCLWLKLMGYGIDHSLCCNPGPPHCTSVFHWLFGLVLVCLALDLPL
jgi:hypothetical protein